MQTEQTALILPPAANPSPMRVKQRIRPSSSACKCFQRVSEMSKGWRGDIGAFPSSSHSCSGAAPPASLSLGVPP